MIIKSIAIENFGPFSRKALSFDSSKINVILGNNATGKTQLVGAILYGLQGKSVVDVSNNSYLNSLVRLDIDGVALVKQLTREYSIRAGFTVYPDQEVFISELHEAISFPETPSLFISAHDCREYKPSVKIKEIWKRVKNSHKFT